MKYCVKIYHSKNEENRRNNLKRKFEELGFYDNKKVKQLNVNNSFSTNSSEELEPPSTYEEIFNRPDKNLWLQAINEELNNMKNEKSLWTGKQNTWK